MRLFPPPRVLRCCLVFCGAFTAAAQVPPQVPPQPVLHSIAEIRSLSLAEAQKGPLAEIESIVLFHDYLASPLSQPIFVGDHFEGIFVNYHGPPVDMHAGQKIRVRGRVSPGRFASELIEPEITLLEEANLPEPLRPNYEELASGILDCRWVEIQGVVRSVGVNSGRLLVQLSLGGARIPITVGGEAAVSSAAEKLVDAVVRVRGVCRTYFNSQRQLIDPGLNCSGLQAFELLTGALASDQMPLLQIPELLTYTRDVRPGHRLKVQGIATYQAPGEMLFIQDAQRGLAVRSNRLNPVAPGDVVEVLGFPAIGLSSPILEDAVYRVIQPGAPPSPREISVSDAASGRFEANYVSLRARVLEDSHQGSHRTIWLQADENVFEAVQPQTPAQKGQTLPKACEILVSGICTARGPVRYRQEVGWTAPAFELLVAPGAQIAVLQTPPWWTPPRILAVLAVVAMGWLGTAAWAGALRKRVRQQTALILQQVSEQAVFRERNRIARELHDTLAQGFAATTFQLEALSDELPSIPEKARRYLNTALTMVRHSLAEARSSVAGLRSEERHSLAEALRASGELLVANGGADFEFSCSGAVCPLSAAQESHLLRIGQEALANAMRHANAQRIRMILEYSSEKLVLDVIDDGRGFQPDPDRHEHGHFGLRGMAERAQEISASLRIQSTLGQGTRITLELPCGAIASGSPGHAAAAGGVVLLPRL